MCWSVYLYYIAMMMRCFKISALTNQWALIYLWAEIHSLIVDTTFGVYSLDSVGFFENCLSL